MRQVQFYDVQDESAQVCEGDIESVK